MNHFTEHCSNDCDLGALPGRSVRFKRAIHWMVFCVQILFRCFSIAIHYSFDGYIMLFIFHEHFLTLLSLSLSLVSTFHRMALNFICIASRIFVYLHLSVCALTDDEKYPNKSVNRPCKQQIADRSEKSQPKNDTTRWKLEQKLSPECAV